jgi:gamma-glutamyltranspeptidase / glutathione hydrolase
MDYQILSHPRTEVQGTFGVVSATHWIPAQVAMGILERGGNAFDAVVAAGFTFHVVDPDMSGFGGELVGVLQRTADNSPVVVCGQGCAPAKATIARYKTHGFDQVPGIGLMAAVVPGSFDAWMLMLRDYGTMRIRDVLEAAIFYATTGFPVTRGASILLKRNVELMRRWPATVEIFLPRGETPANGEIITNKPLAAFLQRFLAEIETASADRETQIEKARKIFYTGFVAEAIDAFTRRHVDVDANGRENVGLLAGEDLCNWRAAIEPPVAYCYRDFRIFKPGPWTQGPVFLQALAILRQTDFASSEPSSAQWVHKITEALKLAFADREAWYGDPNRIEVPIDRLLSDDYNRERQALVDSVASYCQRPGRIDNREIRMPTFPSVASDRKPVFEAHQKDTCHVNVIDRWRNVSAVTTSGGWVQESPVVPGLGFSLSTRAQMFWLQEGVASALEPGTRPRTTLTPTMVHSPDGNTYVFGCRGADHSDQLLLQFFLRLVNDPRSLAAPIEAPAFASEHFASSVHPRQAKPGVLLVERSIGQPVIAELEQMGHEVKARSEAAIGRACAAVGTPSKLGAAATVRLAQYSVVGR